MDHVIATDRERVVDEQIITIGRVRIFGVKETVTADERAFLAYVGRAAGRHGGTITACRRSGVLIVECRTPYGPRVEMNLREVTPTSALTLKGSCVLANDVASQLLLRNRFRRAKVDDE